MSTRNVLIVGGGLAGLTAAFRLYRDHPPAHITLLERSERLGGCIRTDRRDGYVLEAGPDLFLARKPGAWGLAAELGIANRLHGTRADVGGAFVLSHGRLYPLPPGLSGLVPTRVMPFVTTPLISPLGKLRVAMDLLIPARRSDSEESIESFVVRRLGREMYDRLVEPLLTGIYAGDGSRLSIDATFPQLREAERRYGGLLRAAHPPPAKGRTGFVSFPTGMAELPEALASALRAGDGSRVTIRTGVSALSLARAMTGGYALTLDSGEAMHGDAVILAVPAYAAAHVIQSLDADAAAAMRSIPYIGSATVNIAYKRADVPHVLDGTGWITPRAQRGDVLACTWSSSKFAGRAPGDVALFRAFVGDARNQVILQRSDVDIEGVVREELRRVLGVAADPLFVQVNRFQNAMPQYNIGHLQRLAAIDRGLARHPGIAVAGNAYRGVGIPDIVVSGTRAANAAITNEE